MSSPVVGPELNEAIFTLRGKVCGQVAWSRWLLGVVAASAMAGEIARQIQTGAPAGSTRLAGTVYATRCGSHCR